MKKEIERSMFKPLFEAGNIAQMERMNQYFNLKSGWDNFDLKKASYRLRQDTVKIFEALSLYESFKKAVSENDSVIEKEDIIEKLTILKRKAADTANYSHMIILKCNIEISKLKE